MPPQEGTLQDINGTNGLVSFDEMLGSDDVVMRDGCVMCGVWEGLWVSIFSDAVDEDASCDASEAASTGGNSANSNKNNRIGVNAADKENWSPTSSSRRSKPPLSPRTICQVWKRKRREKTDKALQLPVSQLGGQVQGCASWEDRQIQCELKQTALTIQRDFENQSSYDRVYRYEKYGSRGNFST